MSNPVLVPVVYKKCRHSINVISPGVSDPTGQFAIRYAENPAAIEVDWNEGLCWNCGNGFKTQVPPEVTEMLRKEKYGES